MLSKLNFGEEFSRSELYTNSIKVKQCEILDVQEVKSSLCWKNSRKCILDLSAKKKKYFQVLKDGPLVLFAKAGRGSFCEQEEEKLLPSVVKCRKEVLHCFRERLILESKIFMVVIVIVPKKVLSKKKLEKLNQRGKCLRKYFSCRRK